jgi:hypothetical protein
MPIGNLRILGPKSVPNLLEKINRVEIVDDLTSGGSGAPLSAEQGKQLKLSVDTEASNRVAGDLAIIDSASAGYNTLGKVEVVIKDLDSAYKAADAALDTKLTGDINSAVAGLTADIDAVEAKVDAEVLNREIAVSNEALLRSTEDSNLQGAITTEETARIAAISALDSAYKAADVILQNNIDTNFTSLTNSLSTEEASRIAADNTLDGKISTEKTERIADVGNLTSGLNAEISNRTSADSALDLRLSAVETGMATGAKFKGGVASLSDFDAMAEADMEAGWMYVVDSGTGGNRDLYVVVADTTGDYMPSTWSAKSLVWLMDYADVTNVVTIERTQRIAADTQLQNNINTLDAKVDSNKSVTDAAIATLRTDMENADSAEATARQNGDATLQAGLDAEVSNRETAIAAVSASVTAEETARIAAVSAEAATREAEDTAIKALVTAEETARIAADSAEATARQNGDAVNADAIATKADAVDVYDKTVVDGKLLEKADANSVYSKVESDVKYADAVHLHDHSDIVGLSNVAISGSYADLSNKPDSVVWNTGSIMPKVAGVSNIGSPTEKFNSIYTKELHLDANTLYVDGVPVLGSSADTIQISADVDQGIRVATSGTGKTVLDSQSATTIQTNGVNADVLIQTTGSRARVSSDTEVVLTAPTSKVVGDLQVTGSSVITGNQTINGNLTVLGDTVSMSVSNMSVEDNIFVVNKNEAGSGVTLGYAGMQIDRGDLSDARIVWDETQDKFVAGILGSEKVIAFQDAVDLKVDKVSGKGLSTEDYTTIEKNKLAGVEAGAQVNTVTSVSGKTGIVTLGKADVGLSNVDNTSDINKPISTATQTALNAKAPLNNPAFTGTVSGITKAMVGLGSVDNTADASKSVASAAKLTTPITINGVSFDGSANITVSDSTKEPVITTGTSAQYIRGDKTLGTMPTSLPASDVYAWAKAAVKPSYIFSEIGTKPTTLSGYGITDAALSTHTHTANSILPSQTGNANKFLYSNGGNASWVSPKEVISLTDGADVTITSVASGQVLAYNGTSWVNTDLAIGTLAEFNAAIA